MAKQFDPRKVLRQASNALLRRFFAARGELLDVPWDSLTETDVGPVYDAWGRLPESRRLDVQVVLQDANELADPRGLAALADEIRWRCPDRMAAFEAVGGRLDKALWVYLTVPPAFADAARFARADALAAGRYWHKRTGLPRVPLVVTAATTRALADALAGFYPPAQGRGRWCEVEHYRRANGSDYFFAYLDDYPDARVVFDDAGAIRRQPERGAFDNVFVYAPAGGTLETFAHGGRKVREPLEALFCAAVLGEEVGPEGPGAAAYRLDGLADADFAFPTDPADGVAEVRVRRLRLDVVPAPGERLTLEAGPRAHPKAVYHMRDRYLDANALPASALRVAGATLMLTFHAAGGAKPRTLTFDVSGPSSCDLKSRADDLRAVGERCLGLWGVARD